MTKLEEMGRRAQAASRHIARAGEEKAKALERAGELLWEKRQSLLDANRRDLDAAKDAGMSQALLDRLALTEDRIRSMVSALGEVARAPNPVGKILSGEVRPNGLEIQKVSVPLGVVGVIYEARPNVTTDAAALCLKAGNAVILRGGKEAFRSNLALAGLLRQALGESGLPEDCVQLVEDTSRESAAEMMGLTGFLDVLVPRGGAGLIRAVNERSRVPVIETGLGNCHVNVDRAADISMAAEIVYNAKTSRPSVCNAMETLLVHREIAEKALPAIAARLREKHVELRGCERTRAILPWIEAAGEEDWSTEYLDLILAVRVVDSLEEALAHIERYSTGHSECIVTQDYAAAQKFLEEVDSAAVYVNASTRFTDGGEFGLGAELGISTQKLHARGPMGLEQLTSYKFIVRGNGQVR